MSKLGPVFFSLLVGCGGEALHGSVSAIAAPVPVMLGPVRCIGTCGPAPAAKHRYGKELVSEMASRSVDAVDTTYGATTTTTTTTVTIKAAGISFAYPLMTPLVKLPFSKRTVVQLEALDLGRSMDTKGGLTDHRSSREGLLAMGVGYSYALPPPTPAPVSGTEAQP